MCAGLDSIGGNDPSAQAFRPLVPRHGLVRHPQKAPQLTFRAVQFMRRILFIIVMGPLLLSSCTSPFFPLKAMEGVDPHFDFSQWRLSPNQAEPRKVQLGGRILYATTQARILTIVVAQLPITEHPVYGPKETDTRNGEFVVLYRPQIDPRFLEPGNHLIAVGQTSPATQVDVDGKLLSLPTMTAQCIHFWNRSEKDIVISGSPGAGTRTLNEQTYCMTSL